jgi:hypothetical protein
MENARDAESRVTLVAGARIEALHRGESTALGGLQIGCQIFHARTTDARVGSHEQR